MFIQHEAKTSFIVNVTNISSVIEEKSDFRAKRKRTERKKMNMIGVVNVTLNGKTVNMVNARARRVHT